MIAIAILGLVLPGYLLARAFNAPFASASAFPLSAALLTNTVVVYTYFGVPLRFDYVLAALALISIICCIVWRMRTPAAIATTADVPHVSASKPAMAMIGVLVGLILLGLLIRTSLYPLSGFDTVIRWEALARLMLQHQSLSYYPPITADDYHKYVCPEGFPPLVSTVYWWLYAGWGSPLPALTSVAVMLQAVSSLALVFRAGCVLFGSAAGFASIAVLASSSAFAGGLAIGEESGYMALSYAGQLAFTLLAVREPHANSVVIAGIFAGLGASAREYGPLLCLCGIAVLACHRQTRRFLPLFCLVAAASGGLWYLRNWMLTGNPLFPIDVGLGLPANSILAGIMAHNRDIHGPQNFSLFDWAMIAAMLLVRAPLALLVGLPSMFLARKNGLALAMAVALAFFVWCWSISYSAGGVITSFRVLLPAWVALSISAGAFQRWFIQRPHGLRSAWLHAAALLAVGICGCFAALCDWSHPFAPNQVGTAAFSTRADPIDSQLLSVTVAKKIDETVPAPVGILTDDCYFAVAMQRYSRSYPVMAWSPEVAFVFDPHRDPAEVRQMLVAKNIRLIGIGNEETTTYLSRFFRENQSALVPWINVVGAGAIFLIPDQPPPKPTQ